MDVLKVGGYVFEGPFSNARYLKNRSGVYLILCRRGKEYDLIDAGEAAHVKRGINKSERKTYWDKRCKTSLGFAVLYTEKSKRAQIEKEIRHQYDLM